MWFPRRRLRPRRRRPNGRYCRSILPRRRRPSPRWWRRPGPADTNELRAIFGPESRELVSPDAVQAGTGFSNFVRRVDEKVEFARQSDTKIELQIGLDAWPFPIPLVQDNGQWFFDTAAGREEILNRRIGMNELAAIRVCRAYVDAQREYASQPRNGGEVLEYARHLRSTTNTHDGLYWHAEPGEEAKSIRPADRAIARRRLSARRPKSWRQISLPTAVIASRF